MNDIGHTLKVSKATCNGVITGTNAASETNDVITTLEMTSPADLRPGRAASEPIEFVVVNPAAPRLIRSTYVRVWEPLASGGRMDWSERDWRRELSRPGVEAWIARIGGEVAGLVELEAEPDGDVGIVVFGLVPEFIGRGFGAALLTLATKLAWERPGQRPVRRVWLQTSSGDHPHAMKNYLARGFKVVAGQQT